MKLEDIIWKVSKRGDADTLYAVSLPDGSVITVLHRMTGYCGGIFDTETGYRDPIGKFWLASGNVDVRDLCNDLPIENAIDWIKLRANTCKGE